MNEHVTADAFLHSGRPPPPPHVAKPKPLPRFASARDQAAPPMDPRLNIQRMPGKCVALVERDFDIVSQVPGEYLPMCQKRVLADLNVHLPLVLARETLEHVVPTETWRVARMSVAGPNGFVRIPCEDGGGFVFRHVRRCGQQYCDCAPHQMTLTIERPKKKPIEGLVWTVHETQAGETEVKGQYYSHTEIGVVWNPTLALEEAWGTDAGGPPTGMWHDPDGEHFTLILDLPPRTRLSTWVDVIREMENQVYDDPVYNN
jgi:hypothetical protein